MSDDKRQHKVWYQGAKEEARASTITDFSLTEHGHLVVTYHESEGGTQAGETGLINSHAWFAVEPCGVDPNASRFQQRESDELQPELPITTDPIKDDD